MVYGGILLEDVALAFELELKLSDFSVCGIYLSVKRIEFLDVIDVVRLLRELSISILNPRNIHFVQGDHLLDVGFLVLHVP